MINWNKNFFLISLQLLKQILFYKLIYDKSAGVLISSLSPLLEKHNFISQQEENTRSSFREIFIYRIYTHWYLREG